MVGPLVVCASGTHINVEFRSTTRRCPGRVVLVLHARHRKLRTAPWYRSQCIGCLFPVGAGRWCTARELGMRVWNLVPVCAQVARGPVGQARRSPTRTEPRQTGAVRCAIATSSLHGLPVRSNRCRTHDVAHTTFHRKASRCLRNWLNRNMLRFGSPLVLMSRQAALLSGQAIPVLPPAIFTLPLVNIKVVAEVRLHRLRMQYPKDKPSHQAGPHQHESRTRGAASCTPLHVIPPCGKRRAL